MVKATRSSAASPLLQSLLDGNPKTEITVVTRRLHLYAHPRITPVFAGRSPPLEPVWRERFDVVIDFDQPAAGASSDGELEDAVETTFDEASRSCSCGRPTRTTSSCSSGLVLGERSIAGALGLNRRRVRNVYDTTFRLIAELGLPLRRGQEVPAAGWVLAGETWEHAEASWLEITARNHEHRPVAVLNPFGGGHSLKGYVDADGVAAEIGRLVADGYYVIVLPNGTPWGTGVLTAEAVRRVAPDQRRWVAVGPDPNDRETVLAPTVPRLPRLSAADYAMRLVLQWIRRADLVVTVEGWMVHAAYCLGRPYRALMLPYSEPEQWTPFAQGPDQRAYPTAARRPWVAEVAGSQPHPPRKHLLLLLLDELGKADVEDVLPLLRRSLQSPDRDVRRAAARALARRGIRATADLLALLQDPSREVRAVAAQALLDGGFASMAIPADQLTAHVLIGQARLDWEPVIRLGSAVRPVLELATRCDEPSVRREAAIILRFYDRQPEQRRGFLHRMRRGS